MGLKPVTGAATYPLTLTEVKLWLRIDDADQDVILTLLLAAATRNAEEFLGRSLIDQTWDYYLDEFPDDEIVIPLAELIEVVGVFYRDAAGDEQQMDTADYEVDTASEPGRVVLPASGYWPTVKETANAVRVRFRAGYVDSNSPPSAAVPSDIKLGILLIIAANNEHREDVVVGQTATLLPRGSQDLLRPHRVRLGMA